ncbi:MAG TPA: gliding motility lipoprotein GldH [Saprospiraceae bacterium]|nr:gliding motility lipoprotein GldH [Saprospiraceae bacterium]
MQYFSKILFVSFLFLFLGCKENYFFQKSYDIPDAAWTYDNSLDFKVNIKDTSAIYNLFLTIEHSTDYPKQNVYIQIHTQFPTGEKLKEKLSINLASKAGAWYGKCGSKTCTLKIPIQEGAFFNIPGQYQFTIEQYMRVNPLNGIKRVSFSIEDTGVKK